MNENNFPDKIVNGFVEVFPTIEREDSVPVFEALFGIKLKFSDADEYSIYEGAEGGLTYQLQINYDWNLPDFEKKSVGVQIHSFWEERVGLSENKLSKLLMQVPTNTKLNEYGHVDISEYMAELISKNTGYKVLVD